MDNADKKFIEEYKPIAIPSAYDATATNRDKVIFCLADIESGTSDEVAHKIHEHDPSESFQTTITYTTQILTDLYDKGLLKGEDRDGATFYDLSKITTANKGNINPDLIE